MIKLPGTIVTLTCMNLLANDGSGKPPSHFMSGQLLGTMARAFAKLAHGSMLAHVDSIAANGLLAGGIGGERAINNFSACDWRGCLPSAFDYSAQFNGPEKVPHKPRETSDAIYFFNYDLMCELGLDPRMCRKRSVTTKSGETVPPNALKLFSAY